MVTFKDFGAVGHMVMATSFLLLRCASSIGADWLVILLEHRFRLLDCSAYPATIRLVMEYDEAERFC